MKKISLLIAMILCVTIGGVYAAWTYTNPSADITDKNHEQLITIDAADQKGAAGVYKIETNVTKMSIDQYGTGDGSYDYHKAILNYTTNDSEEAYIKFTLDLEENTGNDIFDTLVSKYSVAIVDVGGQYNGTDIFVDLISGETEIDWEYDAVNDIYWYEVKLVNEVAINDFVLANKTEHTNFATALARPVLLVNINDGIAASASNT